MPDLIIETINSDVVIEAGPLYNDLMKIQINYDGAHFFSFTMDKTHAIQLYAHLAVQLKLT